MLVEMKVLPVEHVKKFKKSMIKNEFVTNKMKINLSINMLGKHNETYWSDEFQKPLNGCFLILKTIRKLNTN
jgi:hypothetical protein